MKQTIHNRILPLLLAMMLVLAGIPAFAADKTSGTVVSFDELAGDIQFQAVEVGTKLAELKLPDSLSGTLLPKGVATSTDLEPTGTATDFSGPEAIQLKVTRWSCDLEYDPEQNGGLYTFTPTLALPKGVTLDKALNLPLIRVQVGTVGIMAAAVTSTLDFTAGGNQSGDGYYWASSSKVLTLSGLELDLSSVKTSGTDLVAIKLPADSTIILKDGTTNKIWGGEATNSVNVPGNAYGIFCDGDLTIKGEASNTGTLEVISGQSTSKPASTMYPTAIGIFANTLTISDIMVTSQTCEINQGSHFYSYGVSAKEIVVTGSGKLIGIAGSNMAAVTRPYRYAIYLRSGSGEKPIKPLATAKASLDPQPEG